jgi:hypothetical protein
MTPSRVVAQWPLSGPSVGHWASLPGRF